MLPKQLGVVSLMFHAFELRLKTDTTVITLKQCACPLPSLSSVAHLGIPDDLTTWDAHQYAMSRWCIMDQSAKDARVAGAERSRYVACCNPPTYARVVAMRGPA